MSEHNSSKENNYVIELYYFTKGGRGGWGDYDITNRIPYYT